MAAFTVASVFNAFFRGEEAGIFYVPGGAKGVGVSGLTPLFVRLLMAVAAVLCSGEGFGIDELAGVGGCVRREEGLIGAESKVVMLSDCFGVSFALRGSSDGVRGMSPVAFIGQKK